LVHVRSPHAEALPLVITHGWPGSIVEFQKVIEPLTNPTAHCCELRTRFTSYARLFPVTVSRTSPPAPAGMYSASRKHGQS
jgi:hypothetical protein